jgi:hypothetical protein
VPRPLSIYVTLLHLCGPEALQEKFGRLKAKDSWSVWRATTPPLREVLERDGERTVCPELGTRYPAAA